MGFVCVLMNVMFFFLLTGMRKDKEFLVKYKGLAHIHNRWIPESKLQFEAPSLVAKFSRKHQVHNHGKMFP